jgi:hypothetical protein
MARHRELKPPHKKEVLFPHLATLETYRGISERIKGFRRIKEAIGNIQAVTTVEPMIFLQGLYYDWQQNGITEFLSQNINHVWQKLGGENSPLIVRRLFPNEKGETQDGPRSGNINSCQQLLDEVDKFFKYYQSHYKPENVLPEIMVHRLVNASSPPFQTDPFVPFASGDVIPISSHRFQVRATFGADESTQGFPADIWEVSFEPGGHVKITQKKIASKTQSVIPAENQYETFNIPKDFQDVPSMRYAQIVNIAQVCKSMTDLHSPHRLEFDGTKMNGFHILSIIEAAPFEIRQNTPEVIAKFAQEDIVMPVTVMSSPNDLDKIPDQEKAVVYVNPSFFQGNEQREFITKLSTTARKQYTQLVVLASGNIATQHAVRILMDHGHIVMFVEEENFENNETVRIYPMKKDGTTININWERENPFVFMDKIWVRGIDKIGRKARGLRELQKHGFNVPAWGVIETSMFRRLLSEFDPKGKIALLDNIFDPAIIHKETASIQRAIELCDHNLLDKARVLLDQIGGDRWAIRSSATCEDDEGSSFAGVFKTALNIPAEKIAQSIKQVISSALEPDAIQLARVSGIKPSNLKMAVIIQKMIDAKAAGTMFTIDASARRKDAVRIEATAGLGEGIVDGTAKSFLTLQIDRSTGNTLQSKIDYTKRQIITPGQINQLLKIGLETENKLQEGPQDIEWAIDKEGKIWLLQTRPLINTK